jgi:hypothetical protein
MILKCLPAMKGIKSLLLVGRSVETQTVVSY